MRTATRYFIPVLLAAVAACSTSSRRARTESTTHRGPATLTVDNQSFLDVDIFAVYLNQRYRLGSVTATSRGTMTIPSDIVSVGRRLRFLADPVGSSRTPISEEFFVQPGDTVSMLIAASQVH